MFFSNNRIGSMAADVTVEAAAGYDNEHAIYDVMIESCENQEKLFTAAIFCDMQEAAMLHEGAAVEDIEAFQEASIKGFFQKLKEMVQKLWAKIKAVFHAFIAKLNSWFMKSNKEFAKKYEKEINNKALGKFKISIEKFKGGSIELKTPSNITGSDKDESECLNAALQDITGISNIENDGFEKDYHSHYFEDKDEVTGKDVVDEALKRLKDKESVKDAQKSAEAMNKLFKGLIDKINKFEKANPGKKAMLTHNASKKSYEMLSSGDAKDNDENLQSSNNLRKVVKCYQQAVTKCTSAMIRETKFLVAQDRRIVAKAVAFNPEKHMNEEVEANFIADYIAEATTDWEMIDNFQ